MGRTTVILLLILYLYSVESSPFKFGPKCQACHKTVEGKINVHLVPHSHDDVGWLKTFTDYYYGTGNFRRYEEAGVRFILDSTIQALKKNSDRRFIQVETSFFFKWWLRQTNETKQDIIELVDSGQLEIINGGWSMNDEAATHYQSIIDQFTWGFRILDNTLGKCAHPKIGWQIDPFGHSREHASLLKQFGFDGLVVGRIDYMDKDRRIKDQSLDFTWKTSDDLDDSELFTSMFPDFYVDEHGFQFDVMNGDYIDSSNLAEKMKLFVEILDIYKVYYKTSNIMMPMGNDFTYQVAETNFKNMDKLIEAFANHETYNVIYSTPSCYIQAVTAEVAKKSIKLEKKTDDFFPYASTYGAVWTGYFTSRPTSKRFERLSNNILQSAKQLTTFSRINNKEYDSYTLDLRQAMGVVQHHDAITGTAKQAVAEDYDRLLYKGIKTAEEPISDIILDLLKLEGEDNITVNFATCLLANISICSNSQKDSFLVAVHNPLGRIVTHYVRLPVDGDGYTITGPDGVEVYDIFDTIHSFDYVDTDEKVSEKELVFAARNLPPLGIKLYHIKKDGSSGGYKPFKSLTSSDNTFGSEVNGFTVDTTTGKLNSVTLQGISQQITQEFLYYTTKASGAYLFRPLPDNPFSVAENNFKSVKFVKGNLVDELLQVVSDEVTQIIRVYKNDDDAYIELDWLVGNLNYTAKGEGKEIITRFTVKDFNNEDTFYTDSNGRQQMTRKLNYRPDYPYNPAGQSISSNYYPITARIVIKDKTQNLEVAVLNDRAQGGSSLTNGNIELMVHRRLTADDGLGVNEVLNELQFGRGTYARGQHFLTFSKTTNESGASAAALERHLALKKLLSPWVLVADATSEDLALDKLKTSLSFKFEGLSKSLPDNIHLLTLEPWIDSYILRLEHFFEKSEDEELSKEVTVDLNDLFTLFKITEIKETTLGANDYLTDNTGIEDLKITLSPMQIRTFIIKTDKNNEGGHIDTNGDDDGHKDDGTNSSTRHGSATMFALVLILSLLMY